MRLLLTTGALMIVLAPRPAAAERDNDESQGTEEIRLERKCEQQREKDRRDEDRGRKHPQRGNKWDELCAPPPPPVVVPPVVEPPVIQPPALMPPPGVVIPAPPPA
jgi:hypothetical protein